MGRSESLSADVSNLANASGGGPGLRKVDLEHDADAPDVDDLEAAIGPLPGISLQNGFRFRRGQEVFLHRLADALQRGEQNHLGVFVPGYGKTITALASFVIARSLGAAERLVVFVPRGNLRDQYADPRELSLVFRSLGAPPFSFCVADSDRVFLKNADTQIIITTYQYASGEGGHRALATYCRRAPCLFVFDEVHHLSDDGTWAQMIEKLPFAASVALSGTPMRSDNKTLFGVPFETGPDGDQYYVALHEVTMRDAHAEGQILKRVDAHTIDYHIKMVRQDTGEEVVVSLSGLVEIVREESDVDAYLARRKLRFHEVYLESLLAPAFEQFRAKREALSRSMRAAGIGEFRNHQMLIIAMSNRHAAAILDFVRRRFPSYSSDRIGQDVGIYERSRRLVDYRDGRLDVMVQVDMIGEGTDIKPISTIVKADLVRAHSKTMQQVFRGMRYCAEWTEGDNLCDIYAANDSALVETLDRITSEQQIGARIKKERANANTPAARDPQEASPWELKDVTHRTLKTHSVDFHHVTPPPRREPAAHVMDVNRREKELRKECAGLASELAYALQADGRPVEVRDIHAAAKQRFSKAQQDLSIPELTQKRAWLERCLRSRRLI